MKNIIFYLSNSLIDAKSNSIPEVDASPARLASLIIYAGALAAVISVFIIVIAGIQFILSSGEPGKVAKARNAILYAVVGLIIALSATGIASFVARNVG
jgi:hypothetical protein